MFDALWGALFKHKANAGVGPVGVTAPEGFPRFVNFSFEGIFPFLRPFLFGSREM